MHYPDAVCSCGGPGAQVVPGVKPCLRGGPGLVPVNVMPAPCLSASNPPGCSRGWFAMPRGCLQLLGACATVTSGGVPSTITESVQATCVPLMQFCLACASASCMHCPSLYTCLPIHLQRIKPAVHLADSDIQAAVLQVQRALWPRCHCHRPVPCWEVGVRQVIRLCVIVKQAQKSAVAWLTAISWQWQLLIRPFTLASAQSHATCSSADCTKAAGSQTCQQVHVDRHRPRQMAFLVCAAG